MAFEFKKIAKRLGFGGTVDHFTEKVRFGSNRFLQNSVQTDKTGHTNIADTACTYVSVPCKTIHDFGGDIDKPGRHLESASGYGVEQDGFVVLPPSIQPDGPGGQRLVTRGALQLLDDDANVLFQAEDVQFEFNRSHYVLLGMALLHRFDFRCSSAPKPHMSARW